MRAAIVLALSLLACDEEQKAWEGPCKNVSVIVSTAAGSPNAFTCPNRRHKMRTQLVASSAGDASDNKEQASALVVCECDPGAP